MADKDTVQKTVSVALALCLVCSVVVSTAAVMLKPMQERNVDEDRKRNILAVAGIYEETVSIDRQFEKISARVVDLRSGNFVELNPERVNQLEAARHPARSEALSTVADSAGLGRVEHRAIVYLVGDPERPEILILPVRGAGLWGPMHGFLALRGDLNTVAGLGFYQHRETPGLGGEIDNPRWRGLWPGKQVYDSQGRVGLKVIKGTADRTGPALQYEVDGLSGATLTSRGVNDLVRFWIGEQGFGPFLARLKAGAA